MPIMTIVRNEFLFVLFFTSCTRCQHSTIRLSRRWCKKWVSLFKMLEFLQ